MTSLCKQHLDNCCGFLDSGAVIAGFLIDAGLVLLQSIRDLRTADGLNTFVLHSPDQFPLLHNKRDDLPGFPIPFLNAYVIKEPQCIESFDVTADGIRVQLGTLLCLEVVLDCFLRNPDIAANPDLFNSIQIWRLWRLRLETRK